MLVSGRPCWSGYAPFMAVLDEHHLEQLQRMLLVAGSRAEINENKGLGLGLGSCILNLLMYVGI